MPYIERKDRKLLDPQIIRLAGQLESEGELNYVISRLCHFVIGEENNIGEKFVNRTYAGLNSVMGVLECVKQEFYRTVVAPYEDTKKEQNGPVSNLDA